MSRKTAMSPTRTPVETSNAPSAGRTAKGRRPSGASRELFSDGRTLSRRLVAFVGVAALGLAGCSAGGSSDSTSKKTVTVLTHDAFDLPDKLIDRFEKTTGYKIKTITSGEAGVANQLILTKRHPKYDAVYGIDTYTAGLADKEGVIAAYESPKLPESARQHAVGGLNPVDQGDVCVNVDHAWFKTRAIAEPATLDDLVKPEYAKLLAISDPTTSSSGLAFLAGVKKAKGEEAADQYLKALLERGAKVDRSWSEAYNVDFSAGEGKGRYPLVLSYASSPAQTKGATGSIDATCVRQVEYAGVVEGGNREGAEAFVDYMLSGDVQAAIPEAMYMFPIDASVALPENWRKYAKLVDDPIRPEAAEVTRNREKWLKSWTSIRESAA